MSYYSYNMLKIINRLIKNKYVISDTLSNLNLIDETKYFDVVLMINLHILYFVRIYQF